MNNTHLSEKIEKLPYEISSIFIDLLSDDKYFKDTFLYGVEDFNIIQKNILIEKLIEIEADGLDRNTIINYIQTLTSNKKIIESLYSNIETGVWGEIDEIYKEEEEERLNLEKISENKNTQIKDFLLEDTQPLEEEHISHLDILNEIENPTPSIKSSPTNQKTEKIIAPNTEQKPAKSVSTNNQQQSIDATNSILFHSPTPVAPYTNPALNIASKLDQKLSTPSGSVPKDIYIPKKPDPYHEPVEF